MEIECRRSFACPLGFHAGQLGLPQPQICTVPPKMLDLRLDICEHAIDLLSVIVDPTGLCCNICPPSSLFVTLTDVWDNPDMSFLLVR